MEFKKQKHSLSTLLVSKNTSAFGINFEANISVIFEDNHIVSENIPISLYR